MGAHAPVRFRLTVLNPGGHDREQSFPEGAGEAGGQHAPVNFHAFAACTGGTFQREARRALLEETPVLLLMRGDFRASERALTELKKKGRAVAVSLKETGLHQIAQQLRDPDRLSRFIRILAAADGALATTPEAASLYQAMNGSKPVAFIPTPYPVGDPRWDFSRSIDQRAGILVGTREWNVPTRNHLAALLVAKRIGEETKEMVTVFNCDRRTGTKLLDALQFRSRGLRILNRRLVYPDYLREVSRYKIVLQLDRSCVPGQVAGDALLCRLACVGGNGAIDRLAFTDTCGSGRSIEEIQQIATRLLRNGREYEQTVAESQRRAIEQLSFTKIAKQLADFFNSM
jgi:hypothetical protein